MDKPILYAFSEADLEKIIEKTIDRLSKEKPIQNSDLPPVFGTREYQVKR